MVYGNEMDKSFTFFLKNCFFKQVIFVMFERGMNEMRKVFGGSGRGNFGARTRESRGGIFRTESSVDLSLRASLLKYAKA